MAFREPLPRANHAAVGIGSKLYVWGGFSSDSSLKTATLEALAVSSLTWKKPQVLHGFDLPSRLRSMAVTTDGTICYSFGGVTGSSSPYTRHDTLLRITPTQQLCEELQPTSPSDTAPEKKQNSGILYYKDKLVLFGGYTGQGRTNELHVFDLKKRVWATQPTTGEQPPPLSSHTFTKIDHHRAVLFGGSAGSTKLNDTYVLNMETWHWTKLMSEVLPPVRYDHAACCIAGPLTGQDHPLLMVVGGRKKVLDVLRDVWLLDVDKGMWSEVTLPEAIMPRQGHSATVFGSGSFRVVVLFGGFDAGTYLSETLLLLELREGSWQVTRVVKSYELIRPDGSLREQMWKLELSPQEGVVSGVADSLKKEQERREEAEREVQQLKKRLSEHQTQSSATDGAASPTSPKVTSPPTHTSGGRAGTGKSTTTDTAAATTADKGSTHTSGGQAQSSPTIDIKEVKMGRRLGKGAGGTVYEATWRRRTVAAKVCPGNLLEEFSREIQILKSLPPHPYVLTFFGVALSTDIISTSIITELAPNGSLHDYLHIKKEKPSPDQSLAWAQQIASGMQHLHNNNIVHRDLKSGNILLALGLVAKVCDFGSARTMAKTTMTNQAGTYRWMAPEIIDDVEANINKMCDVFSYGMVLYEIFARQIPYAELSSNARVAMAVLQGKRPPIPPTLPPFLHPLLKACWEEDPSKRPQFGAIVLAIQTGLFE